MDVNEEPEEYHALPGMRATQHCAVWARPAVESHSVSWLTPAICESDWAKRGHIAGLAPAALALGTAMPLRPPPPGQRGCLPCSGVTATQGTPWPGHAR